MHLPFNFLAEIIRVCLKKITTVGEKSPESNHLKPPTVHSPSGAVEQEEPSFLCVEQGPSRKLQMSQSTICSSGCEHFPMTQWQWVEQTTLPQLVNNFQATLRTLEVHWDHCNLCFSLIFIWPEWGVTPQAA